MSSDKVIRDGKVAVIYNNCYGSGFSTEISDYKLREKSVFDPIIVEFIESLDSKEPMNKESIEQYLDYEKRMDKYIAKTYYLSMVEPSELEIEWLPVGTLFYISEYDGLETVVELSSLKYFKA